MKRNLYAMSRSWFSRIMLLSVLLLCGAAAQAENVTVDDIQLDTEYKVSAFVSFNGTFTAPKSGALVVKSNTGDYPLPYSDEACTQAIDYTHSFLGNGQSLTFPVVEGQKYYFYQKFFMTESTIVFSMDAASELTYEASVAEGTVFPLTSGGHIGVVFNQPITLSGITLTSGANTAQIDGNLVGNNLSISIKETLFAWLNDGRVKGGDELVVTISGVCAKADPSVKAGDNGTITLRYLAPEMPVQLVELSMPEKFLSYYVNHSEEGIIRMTFDGTISTTQTPQLVLGYGNLEGEEGEYYVEEINGEVSGNVVTFDLRGKLRTPALMVTSGTNYGVMNLRFAELYDEQGNYVYSDGQGTMGSFSEMLNYEEVKVNLVHQFTPESGSTLAGVDQVELWIRGYNSIVFDGVQFSYVSDGQTATTLVPLSNIKVEAEDDEAVLTISVPEAVKGKQNITVSLAGLEAADGREHLVVAKYDAFVATLLEPTATELAVLEKGAVIHVTTNMNDKVGCMVYQIRDLNPADADHAIVKTMAYFEKQADGTFLSENRLEVKLVRGHEYAIEVSAYESESALNYGSAPLGTETFILSGLSEPFTFSTYNFVSITPDPETFTITSADQRVFTVEFDGLAMLDTDLTFINTGMGTKQAFEKIEAVDADDRGYSAKWQLTVGENFMRTLSDALSISVKAYDQDGKLIEGNSGREANSYLNFVYVCSIGTPELSVSPAPGTVESLKEFSITAGGKAINFSYFVRESDIVLYNLMRDEVAHAVIVESVIPEEEYDNWDYQSVEVKVVLDKEITEPGSYVLFIPAQAFALGTEFDQNNSLETVVSYTIEGNPDSGELIYDFLPDAITPADGSVVESLSQFSIDFISHDWDVAFNQNKNNPVSLYNKATGELVTNGYVDWTDDWDDYHSLWIILDDEVTTPGTYQLVIEANTFGDNDWDMTMYQRGHCSPELIYEYTVGAAADLSVKSLDELSNDKAYTLTNANGMGKAIYNPNYSATDIWLGEATQIDDEHYVANESYAEPVDVLNANNNWQIVLHEGKYYLYNVGADMFAVTGRPCTLQAEPIAINIVPVEGGFAFNTTEDDTNFMCASPQLVNPVAIWTSDDKGSVWVITENPDVEVDANKVIGNITAINAATVGNDASREGIYTISGVKLQATDPRRLPQGVYIINGKKVVKK